MAPTPISREQLVGKWWIVGIAKASSPQEVSAASGHPYIDFLPNGTVQGTDEANSLGGHYTVETGTVRFSDVSITLVGVLNSAPESMKQLDAAFGSLTGTQTVNVRFDPKSPKFKGKMMTITAGDYVLTAKTGPVD